MCKTCIGPNQDDCLSCDSVSLVNPVDTGNGTFRG